MRYPERAAIFVLVLWVLFLTLLTQGQLWNNLNHPDAWKAIFIPVAIVWLPLRVLDFLLFFPRPPRGY